MSQKTSIVFFGTGPVAAKSLQLLSRCFKIEAVVTKPRPLHHRGSFPVIEVAEELSLPLLTVTNKQSVSALMSHHSFESRVGVLIDFGIIVAQDVIDSFEKGIVNSHFSLLPQWRGADPITFSILSGQKTTGVSLMLLVKAMDEGPLLSQTEVSIDNNETTPSLTEKLIIASAQALETTIPHYLDSMVAPKPQLEATVANSKEPTYSRKLEKKDGIIDWNKPAAQIEREIRAYTGWPQSKTTLGTVEVIITEAKTVFIEQVVAEPGEVVLSYNPPTIEVGTSSGMLHIKMLKPVGKKEMSVQAFLAGYKNKLRESSE